MYAPHSREEYLHFIGAARAHATTHHHETYAAGLMGAVLARAGHPAARIEDVDPADYAKVTEAMLALLAECINAPFVWAPAASEVQPADAAPAKPVKQQVTLKNRFWAPDKAFEMGLDT